MLSQISPWSKANTVFYSKHIQTPNKHVSHISNNCTLFCWLFMYMRIQIAEVKLYIRHWSRVFWTEQFWKFSLDRRRIALLKALLRLAGWKCRQHITSTGCNVSRRACELSLWFILAVGTDSDPWDVCWVVSTLLQHYLSQTNVIIYMTMYVAQHDCNFSTHWVWMDGVDFEAYTGWC